MNIDYSKYMQVENDIYKEVKEVTVPTSSTHGNEQINEGLSWISKNTASILDFGCGSGSMLFYCAIKGVNEMIGIDLSEEGIKLCRKRAELMNTGKYTFIHGSVNELKDFKDNSIDAAILSNTIDNISPDDSKRVLGEIHRIVRSKGKILIKLNPLITNKQIKEWNIKVIKDNFLDDGLLLWNQTTDEWRELFLQYFDEYKFVDVYFKEYEQHNRMFLLINK